MPLIFPSNTLSGGYTVANSCRFDGTSAYMGLTLGTPTNNKIYTFSAWVKRSKLGQYGCMLNAGSTTRDCFRFRGDNDHLHFFTGEATTGGLETNRVFRDPSAWYHLVCAVDTTQATDTNRVKLYVNGVQETSFTNSDYPAQDYTNVINSAVENRIGKASNTYDEYFGGYMAEAVFIDGQQLTPTSFGEYDEDSPTIWKPIDVSELTFGDNGFYLSYSDSADLGADSSGNSNDFTVTNLDATDQATDTPTNNFATWNPLIDFYPTYSSTLSNGNLSTTRDDNGGSLATIMPSQGKWYMEAKCGTVAIYNRLGVVPYDKFTDNEFNPDNKGVSYQSDGDKVVDSSASAYGNTYTTGDIIGIALNLDDGEITFYKNGVAQNSGTSITGFTYDGANSLTVGGSGSTWSWDCNFGNPPYAITSGNADADGYGNFEYAVPSGFYALCTKNLAEYG